MKKAISILSLIIVILLSETTKAQSEYIYGSKESCLGGKEEIICLYYKDNDFYRLIMLAKRVGENTKDVCHIDLGNKEESIKMLEEICFIANSSYIQGAIINIFGREYTMISDKLGDAIKIEQNYIDYVLKFDVKNLEKIIANIKKYN